jgi:dTDP-4-dehydrorhamnose 3,5-epimerase
MMRSIESLGAICITPKIFGDDRGRFSETYNKRVFTDQGITCDFIQDNQSYSAIIGTLRGLHFQTPPHAQGKLIRVLRGRIYDVIVDIRTQSPSFGQWAGIELDAKTGTQLFVPAGFAHGFMTLEADTEVLYKVDAFYNPQAEGGLRWDDPALGIDWPVPPSGVVINARDAAFPVLADLPRHF